MNLKINVVTTMSFVLDHIVAIFQQQDTLFTNPLVSSSPSDVLQTLELLVSSHGSSLV